MKKTHIALLLIGACVISFMVGFLTGRTTQPPPEVMFYAKVLEARDNRLLVEGIAENDVNHRSRYVLTLRDPNDKNAVLDENGNAIHLIDVPVGSLVRIAYSGLVLTTYPAQITDVTRIQVVE